VCGIRGRWKLGRGVDEGAAVKAGLARPFDDELHIGRRPGRHRLGLDARAHFLQELLVAMTQRGLHQLFLGRKVAVQRALGDVALATELIDAGGMKALSIEQIKGALDEIFAFLHGPSMARAPKQVHRSVYFVYRSVYLSFVAFHSSRDTLPQENPMSDTAHTGSAAAAPT